MLSFLVFRPATPQAEQGILLFLHGVGEGSQHDKISSAGIRNLLRQGVPRLLLDPDETLPADHPLMGGAFAVVAPQLPDRHAPWLQPAHVEQIRQTIDGLAPPEGRRLYIVGFSKGGRPAFQLASGLRCRALVTIDASPTSGDPAVMAQAAAEIAECQVPFWSIYTGYPKEHRLAPIQQMHESLAIPAHDAGSWDALVAPAAGAKCVSRVGMEHEPDGERHGALCTAVTRSRAPFEWLLKHQADSR
jgi:hypothetical protein